MKNSNKIDQTKDFLMLLNKLGSLNHEVTNLGREIKIFEAIALMKRKNGNLRYESFFGFLQSPSSLLKLIVIDSIKIVDNAKKYISSITKTTLTPDQLGSLFQNSKIQSPITKMAKIIDPLRGYRNKRYAHFEDAQLQNLSCDLNDIYISLADLYSSLNYVIFYLSNQHYIKQEEWNHCLIHHFTADTISTSSFEQYFQEDPTVVEFKLMLIELHKSHPGKETSNESEEDCTSNVL